MCIGRDLNVVCPDARCHRLPELDGGEVVSDAVGPIRRFYRIAGAVMDSCVCLAFALHLFGTITTACSVVMMSHIPQVRIGGFCVECGPGEVGEALSEVKENASTPAQRFEGYKDEAANQKKLLRNVFRTGDCYFRSGDLMQRDAEGSLTRPPLGCFVACFDSLRYQAFTIS